MRKLVVSLLMAVSVAFGACATLNPNGHLNVPLILEDARFGIMEACSVEWLPQDVCTLGLDTLSVADQIAAQDTLSAAVAVKQLLIDVEVKLPADSRLRPYLDAVILILHG